MLNKKFSLLAGSAALMLGNVCAIAHAAENNVTISSDQGMQAVQTKVQPRNYTINIATPAAQNNEATAPEQLNSAKPAATQVNSAPPAAAQAKSAPVKSATVKSAPVAGQVKPYIPDDAPVAKAPAAAPAPAPATLAPAPACLL